MSEHSHARRLFEFYSSQHLTFSVPPAPSIAYVYSESEKVKLEDIKNAFTEDFQVGKVYPDPASLKGNARALAEIHGFVLSQNGNKLACNRAALTEADLKKAAKKKAKNPNAKPRKRQSTRCGCEFFFTISPDRAGLPCKIVSANFTHTNGCTPGAEQLVDAQRRSGYYMKTVLHKAKLETLITLQERAGYITPQLLRSMLEPLLPRQTAISCDMLNNVRLKLNRLVTERASSPTVPVEVTEDIAKDLLNLETGKTLKDNLSAS